VNVSTGGAYNRKDFILVQIMIVGEIPLIQETHPGFSAALRITRCDHGFYSHTDTL
jgi:hypothetical protein